MTRPTIVFVHGAFADSSIWHRTMELLATRGHSVLAVANPLRGLHADAAYVRSVIASLNGPVLLVGHSYGGAVVSVAATGLRNVTGLVFVAAYILDQGESISAVLEPASRRGTLLSPHTTVVRPCPNPASPDGGDLDIYIRPHDFHDVFAADLDAAEAQLLALTQRPLSVTASTSTAGLPAWRFVPVWALVPHDDRIIPASAQTWMAERAGAEMTSVDASHAVMVSRPDAVAELVEAALTALDDPSWLAS